MWGAGGIMEHAVYRADLALFGEEIVADVRITVVALRLDDDPLALELLGKVARRERVHDDAVELGAELIGAFKALIENPVMMLV